MPATRRRLLTASIGLSMPFIRPAAARRSLTFAVPSGVFQTLHEPLVAEALQRAHPDISVFYYPLPSAAQALAVLRRQRDLPDVDAVLLDAAVARTATDEGLLEPLTPATLPVMAELASAAVFSGIAGPALYTEPLVLLFDPARARPAPVSWKTLWNGRQDQPIAIAAPPDDIGLAFTLTAGRLFGGGDHQRTVNDGLTAIGQLTRRVVSWDPRPDIYRFIADGRGVFGMGWNMAAQFHASRLKGRLGVVFPDDGTLSRVTTVNLVKGSRQPEAARQFIAWLLGAEAQKLMVERLFLGPVNAKARYLEAALQRTANTPARAARAMAVDWVVVNEMRGDITRRWRDLPRGGG